MRHQKSRRKLNRTSSHRRAMLSNMAASLLQHERIRTTDAKAKEVRRVTERLITMAKKGGLANRRLAYRTVRDRAILGKLFDEIGPRYSERPGGYTRILKLGYRRGDNAALSLIELVEDSSEA